ncbi:MAG: hypothetical protein CMF96_06935 [Candidatus Marinimicrobia bacterium]|nr:hypothetical protein [Candidatus Neomarinimicrobiota bacterium]
MVSSMKLAQNFLKLFFLLSISSAQIVDLFISDWYIGWRGQDVYNNLLEIYNPKEVEVNLSHYMFRRTQNGSDWQVGDGLLRLGGTIPAGETFTITRAAANIHLLNCANLTYGNGEPAGYVDENIFLKQSGDDAVGIFYIGEQDNDDTLAWIESAYLLDAVGSPNDDPGNAWDVSGIPEATRYYILQRKFDVCGGNGGDWNTSRGCVNDNCTQTAPALSEWEVIGCALDTGGPDAEPDGDVEEASDAEADMLVICDAHGYLCLEAPNSPPGSFALQEPVSSSILNVNSENTNETVTFSWLESYDPDGDNLQYVFSLWTPDGHGSDQAETVYYQFEIENELSLDINLSELFELVSEEFPNNNCLWDVTVADLEHLTESSNGPFSLEIILNDDTGQNQPPTEFEISSPDDYSLLYLYPNNLEQTVTVGWGVSEDPDGENITYLHTMSFAETLSDPIDEINVESNSMEVPLQEFYDLLISQGVSDAAIYWDVISSDGQLERSSSNGPFMFYCYLSEDPTDNEETYSDLFITDWYVGFRGSPTYNTSVELYNPKNEPIDLSNYILRRTSNGSHWMETSWIRLDGILPPNTTYVVTRAASDLSLQDCADLVEPDDFLKHTGDDGIKVTHIGYLPEALAEDTTAWLKMSVTLDAIGYANEDPGDAWDVSGVTEATRYYILSRNMDVCGGNAGDWNASRGCINDECSATSAELGEWTPTPCLLSPAPGDMPASSDALVDAAIFCGNHNFLCGWASIENEIYPQKIELEQNYPNPFNPKTEISFTVSIPDQAALSIFNIRGQEVLTLLNRSVQAGKHTVSWSGKDSMGMEVSSGMYFYILKVGKVSFQRKLILLR